jgi:hypothetical protein
MKPSDYFGRNVFFTPSSPRRREAKLRHEIGVDAFMFGADFPHPESTWPNTLTWLQATFYDVPENELRPILGENAINVYGLDRAMLSTVAARIGPALGDIIGEHKVDQRLVADFHRRAHFLKDTPTFDLRGLDHAISVDLAATAG